MDSFSGLGNEGDQGRDTLGLCWRLWCCSQPIWLSTRSLLEKILCGPVSWQDRHTLFLTTCSHWAALGWGSQHQTVGGKKKNPGKTEVVLLRKQESFLRNAERHPLINQEPGSLSGWFSTSGALSKGPSVIWGAWSEWQMRRGGCVGSQGSVGTAWGEPQSPAPGGGTARSRHLQWCASCVCRSSKEKSLALNVVFDVFFVCK